MNKLTSFTVGETYTNDQIRFSLDLENLGGIRPSLDANRNVRHVAILTAAEESGRLPAENPYHDRIEGNILIYTAQGRVGDQDLLAGRNKRLIEQYSVPTPFFGFVNIGRQTYRFLGLLELLRHYQENQADRKGAIRKVWLFEFRIHDKPEVVPVEDAPSISASLLAESRRNNPMGKLEREVSPLPQALEESAGSTAMEVETVRARLFRFTPYDFERFIKLVLERSGFVGVSVTRATGDGGIDVDAYVDETNEFFAGTHLQAQVKRWRHAVGSPEINNFRGALSTTAKGVFVTTSHFTRAALAEARHESKPSIALVDGDKLAGIIIRTHISAD
jgi:HJR/Mrr/RecB family endonuclease